ncbi:hypothetical protein BB561_005355 [Smittium simulii]|uniref:Major facilitator superfamily (MFS) profile domain-containing protein n=1 Tax=Smittium simulii TaxID=133385 RepID=A0A2T9YAT5_9FUNG|nr:hypothetical protein BB561_005355 [Smittium simulii]
MIQLNERNLEIELQPIGKQKCTPIILRDDLNTQNDSDAAINSENLSKYDNRTAFLVLIFCCLIKLVISGLKDAYPIYNYLYIQKYSDSSPSAIGWIGILILVTVFVMSPIVTIVTKKVGYFWTIVGGTLLSSLGLLIASFSIKLWQTILYHGLIFGIGLGFPFLVSISLVSVSFQKYIGLAMGIFEMSGGIGGLLFSFGYKRIVPELGLAWSIRISSIILAVVVIGSAFAILLCKKSKLQPWNKDYPTRKNSTSAVPNVKFKINELFDAFIILLGIATMLGDIAFITVQFYLPITLGTLDKGLNSVSTSVFLMNLGKLIGYFLWGYLTIFISEITYLVITSHALSAIVILSMWNYSNSVKNLQILSFFFGLSSACFTSQIPSIISRSYPKSKNMQMLSLLFFFIVAGILSGIQISSRVYSKNIHNDFTSKLQILSVCFFLASSFFFICAIWFSKHRK